MIPLNLRTCLYITRQALKGRVKIDQVFDVVVLQKTVLWPIVPPQGSTILVGRNDWEEEECEEYAIEGITWDFAHGQVIIQLDEFEIEDCDAEAKLQVLKEAGFEQVSRGPPEPDEAV